MQTLIGVQWFTPSGLLKTKYCRPRTLLKMTWDSYHYSGIAIKRPETGEWLEYENNEVGIDEKTGMPIFV